MSIESNESPPAGEGAIAAPPRRRSQVENLTHPPGLALGVFYSSGRFLYDRFQTDE